MTPLRITLLVGGSAAALGLGVCAGAWLARSGTVSSVEASASTRAIRPGTTEKTDLPANGSRFAPGPAERSALHAILSARLNGDRSVGRRELRARLARLPLAEVQALLAALPRSVSSETTWWRQALVESWAVRDPQGALQWVRELDRTAGQSTQGLLNNVIHVWAQTDPAGAAAEVGRFKSLEEQRVAIETVLAAWTGSDPAAAQAWLAALPAGEVREHASVSLVRELARRDPRAALQFALAAAPARWSERSVGTALGELTRTDPAAGLEAFEQLPNGAVRDGAASRVTSALAEKDPAAAGQFALTLPAGPGRKDALEQVMQAMGRTDADQAMRWLNERVTDAGERRVALEGLIRSVSNQDPAAAARLVDQAPEKQRGPLAERIAAYWGYQDPDAAMAWVRNLPASPERTQLSRRLLTMLSIRDPDRSIAMANSLLSGPERTQAFSNIGAGWGYRDPAQAMALARQIANPADRAEFVAGLGGSLGRTRPREVLAMVAELPPGPGRERAMERTIASWSYRDPRAAAEWIVAQPGSTSAAGFSTIAASWVELHPASFETWMNTLPAGPRRDVSLASAAANSTDSNPTRAANWTLEISDPARRSQALEQMMGSWSFTDRAAALAWLDTAPLSDATKRRLREVGR